MKTDVQFDAVVHRVARRGHRHGRDAVDDRAGDTDVVLAVGIEVEPVRDARFEVDGVADRAENATVKDFVHVVLGREVEVVQVLVACRLGHELPAVVEVRVVGAAERWVVA